MLRMLLDSFPVKTVTRRPSESNTVADTVLSLIPASWRKDERTYREGRKRQRERERERERETCPILSA